MNKIFIIGAQKAGTSSLYNWIGQHPQVYSNVAIKDYHFFSNDKFYLEGIPAYEKFIKPKSQHTAVLAGGVNYIYFTKIFCERISEHFENPKFIVVFRDPVKRAFSAYNYFKKNGEDLSRTFHEAIENEKLKEFQTHEDMGRFNYIDHGFYSKQLRILYDYFDPESVKCLIYEELFKESREDIIKSIFEFVEVNDSFIPKFDHLNKTGAARFPLLNRMIYSQSRFRRFLQKTGISKLMGLKLKTQIAYLIRSFNTQTKKTKDSLSKEEYQSLRSIFQEDIDKLGQLLDKDLHSLWKM